MPCLGCGASLPTALSTGRKRKWCLECRPRKRELGSNPRPPRVATPKPEVRCTRCGGPMAKWSGSAPLPKCEPVCLACRRTKPAPTGPRQRYGPMHGPKPLSAFTLCPCGEWFEAKPRSDGRLTQRCSKACEQRRRNPVPRDAGDDRSKRHQREIAAPGLTRWKRDALLRRWITWGRTCAYCPAAPTSVDHVMPLWLGGTNFEGNLVPCCRSCNSSKGTLLFIEWRVRRDSQLRRLPLAVRREAA
jgi:5-methylcytosine-specific restriction endonuclease McrA